jgi:uncharacterized protein
VRLAALFVHPVKSCAAIAVARARVTRQGLEHDRRWMLVDGDGLMVSQREHPEMALLKTRLTPRSIVVSREDLPPLELPFVHEAGARIAIKIWKHAGEAVRHDDGGRWFARALGRDDVQLVNLPPSIARPLTPDYARPGETTSFADEFPFLVAGAASLEDLSARAGTTFDMRRFRPSLVIAGAAPWAEDEWRNITVGKIRFRLLKPCARCPIPQVDPNSGRVGKEPLRTMATFRKRDNQVYFGVNAVADDEGELALGDEVTVVD